MLHRLQNLEPEQKHKKLVTNTLKVTEHFQKSKGKTLVSFEVLPPLKGGSMQAIFNTLDVLMEFKPPFIDVTYHREEFIYNKRASGYYEKTAIRKRPGTVGICAALMHRYGVDAVPHLICGGFSVEETENALIDLNFLGKRLLYFEVCFILIMLRIVCIKCNYFMCF